MNDPHRPRNTKFPVSSVRFVRSSAELMRFLRALVDEETYRRLERARVVIEASGLDLNDVVAEMCALISRERLRREDR